MRKGLLLDAFSASLMFGSVTLLATSFAAGQSSSIGFVDNGMPAASEWSDSSDNPNPLRSASMTDDGGNSLRFAQSSNGTATTASKPRTDANVAPASYSERSSGGLQLRPHTQPTGILSGLLGETKSSKPSGFAPKPRVAPQSSAQTAKSSAPPKSMLPKFLSGATKFPSLNKTGLLPEPKPKTEPPTAMMSRAGSVQHSQPKDLAVQAAYQSAAAAEQYRPPTNNPRTAAQLGDVTRGMTLPSLSRNRPTEHTALAQNTQLASKRPGLQPMTRAAAPAEGGQASSTTLALARAHKASATAKTEAEFSEILTICQKIRSDQATPEETAFGRQLASWALNRRGQLRAGAGRTDEAMADFDTAIRLDSKCWRAIHNRGVLYAQTGQLEAAFDDFQRTTDLNPNYAKAYSNRAALYVLAGELEPALADYQHAAKLDPKLAVAQRGCGRTCHMLGQMNEALEHFDAAIELVPGDATTLTSRGDLLTDLGYYGDAEADYDRAIDANAKCAEAYRSSAWLLATCPDNGVRNPELALRRAETATKLERNSNAVTYDTLAAAQAAVGDFGSAVSTIRRAIEVAPPSERGAYQDRLQMYQQETPYTISPVGSVQQARFEH